MDRDSLLESIREVVRSLSTKIHEFTPPRPLTQWRFWADSFVYGETLDIVTVERARKTAWAEATTAADGSARAASDPLCPLSLAAAECAEGVKQVIGGNEEGAREALARARVFEFFVPVGAGQRRQ